MTQEIKDFILHSLVNMALSKNWISKKEAKDILKNNKKEEARIGVTHVKGVPEIKEHTKETDLIF